MSLLASRAWRGTHHPVGSLHPTPPCWDPFFGAPCQTKPYSPGCCDSIAIPTLIPVRGDVRVWGQSSFFWRLPDNSALYLPPVPPNTLVSAAALCCKFPWSNYVLIYDNPGRAVEGAKRQSSLEVARRGSEGSPCGSC